MLESLLALLGPSTLLGGRYRMETDLTKAQHYRDLAAKMRELAAQEIHEPAKKSLISLAEKYDELCHKLIDRTERDPR